MQSAAALAGYTDTDNPFNDQQLTKPFLWHKKQQQRPQQREAGGSVEALQARQAALVAEVEEVKARRRAREEEKRCMDAMKEQMDRERAAEQVAGWEEKEEDFHRQQARRRTKIRVQERRERAVDLLMKNVAFEQWLAEDEEEERVNRQRERMRAGAGGDGSGNNSGGKGGQSSTRSSLLREAQLTNPVSLLSALPLSDLVELRGDVTHLLQLNENVDYWTAIAALCDDETATCKGEQSDGAVAAGVRRDIEAMLRDQSPEQLHALAGQVKAALEEGADLAYWQAVRRRLEVHQAKASLRESHAEMLKRRLELLKGERSRRDAQQQEQTQQRRQQEEGDGVEASETSGSLDGDARSGSGGERSMLAIDTTAGLALSDEASAVAGDDSNADHHLSPRLFSFDEQLDVTVTDTADDQRTIAQQRAAVLAKYQPHVTMQQLHRPAEDTASAPMLASADTEYTIANEVSLPPGPASSSHSSSSALLSSSLPWSSKWRPRKPRYFNRVKTGFDWNKYNQVHYDKDNPPPKLVQGYKFNVFYPDLLDATRTPTYRLLPSPDGSDAYCILRFSAGPPYEDVAFKIVRKEWEFGPRRGFRCSFDKGVLQLHFNFKRYFYRR